MVTIETSAAPVADLMRLRQDVIVAAFDVASCRAQGAYGPAHGTEYGLTSLDRLVAAVDEYREFARLPRLSSPGLDASAGEG
jgi:hypothetical protein